MSPSNLHGYVLAVITSPSYPYWHCCTEKVRAPAGNPATRKDNLLSGKREKKFRKKKKKDEEINLVTIKPLIVLTANPQIHKHTEGVLGIKAFN